MAVTETIIIFLSSALCLYLLSVLIKLLHRVWWTPLQIQRVLSSQGISGRPYRLFHGNSPEIHKMKTQSLTRPMGLSHHIFPRVQPHLHSWLNTYGKNFVIWVGPKAHLVTRDSEFAKEILNNKEKAFSKADIQVFLKKLFGDGLGVSEGEKWAKLRKLANHAFRVESLKNMAPAMVDSAEKMLERWKHHEGKEMEVSQEFRVLTSEVISRTAFGSSYLDGQVVFDKLNRLAVLASKNLYIVRLPGLSQLLKSSDEIESEKLAQEIRDSIEGMVKEREKAVRELGNDFGTDLLGLLVKAKNDPDENNRITIEDVIDECKTFYFAGHDTTSTLLGWTILLLATHADWQEKAREEVVNIFGQQQPNLEGIARMKTMSIIINETLRLYPPVVNFTRKVQRKVKLGNLTLPANMNVIVSTLALHGDPQIWGEDVHLFKPERFSEGVAKATNNNQGVYIPFGLGPRNCVGMNFALNEAKIALSMMLQRYAFTLSPTYTHAPFQVLAVLPQHGIQVKLHAL